ncbi:MAG: protein kinase, partial [Myxococcales bacterium]|nr:protein kinase [Myxococcales bacterium]
MDRSDADSRDEPLGAYQVVRQLRGAERDIYLARKGLGAPEQLLVVVEGNVADRARLKAELARLRGVEHDAILKPVETFTLKGNRTVLVFGDFSGASLHRVMVQLQNDSERMALTAVCYIGARIAEALAAAHGATDEKGALAPIVHAHVAPEQVLLAWSGAVRLLGLGLGPFMEPSRLEARERGTEPYVAPELRGKDAPATIEANVYSLAAMVWALFSGRDPPAKVKAAPVRSVRTDVPARISDAIERNMSPDPAARDVSCRELGELLGEIGARKGRDELRWNLEVFRALIAIGDDDVTSVEAFPVSRPRPGAAPAEREPAPPAPSDEAPTPRVTDKQLAGEPGHGASAVGPAAKKANGGSVRDRLAKARGAETADAGQVPGAAATRGAGTLRGMARGEVPKTPAGTERTAPGKQSRSPSSFERPRGLAAKGADDARREEEEQNYTPSSEDSVTMVRGWHEKLAKDAEA